MRAAVTDGFGNEIYLTEERWQHVVDEHPEMEGREEQLLETIRNFPGLPAGNTTMVAVVHIGFRPDGGPRNFVLTAYQISRMRG